MSCRSSLRLIAVATVLAAALTAARAFDETRYPNWKGQWRQLGGEQNSLWDPGATSGAVEATRLTPEYRAIYEASLGEEAAGGFRADPAERCVPAAMPRVMMAVQPMEIVINPDATYFILEQSSTLRRVYTDGRKFPDDIEPGFTGYSVGEWRDTDGDGRFDTLLIETRRIRGPHVYDSSGIPFHKDGEAVVMERLYADKTDPNVLHNEITTVDHAIEQPWTVTRSYRRVLQPTEPEWAEFQCKETDRRVQIGNETYGVSPDGFLTPVRKGQKAPSLKYFRQ